MITLDNSSLGVFSTTRANMQMVKQLGRWRPDIIAQGYIETSVPNREMIYNGVIQKNAITDIHSKPSTSTQRKIKPENADSDHHINWSDFDEVFAVNDVDSTPSEVVKSSFTAVRKNPIFIPITHRNKPGIGKKNLFFNKPRIKLPFKNVTVQSPTCKRKKNNEDSDDKNHNHRNSVLKDGLKFSNCTFNNCIFNITLCNCNKEKKS
ncbi:uncharacterized protein [Venturia canescens]|uniref:uncharacterized protein n=1 Tax=Venturia canescens TaxID=32260 RepID=UPI001C9CA091|nr:uncharacterized protein LOC122417049 [Venturia canescens]XP_043286227.1 uncharacterized protein LOC122417049 [Venturia canescens]XP_043286228.1 uncharacterized protein LOC122417049 [Venturia canescens]